METPQLMQNLVTPAAELADDEGTPISTGAAIG
jgi:hypothetical protein